MRVVLPTIDYDRPVGLRLAPRPPSLDGLRVGFLDGWGTQHDDGSVSMYPLMAELERHLARRYKLRDVVWLKKPSISKPVPFETLSDFLRRADVVINGEAA